MIQTIQCKEEALASARANLGELNEICRRGGFPELTAEEAVIHYYRPRGSASRDFYLTSPDGGANNASCFSPTHFWGWEMTVITSTGKTPVELGLYDAQDAAAFAAGRLAPAIQAEADRLFALTGGPQD